MNTQVTEALRKLYLGQRSGTLLCEGADAKRSVLFDKGFVVAARSSLKEDRLGEVMIRHGRINRQQFEDAARFIKSGWKLGEILAELRIIEKEEIDRFVRIQLLDIVCSVIIHPPVRMVFTDEEKVDGAVARPLSVADAIMEAARRSAGIEERLSALLAAKSSLSITRNATLQTQDVNLSAEEGFILSRVDGHESPKSIAAMSPVPEKETARTLLGLLEAGIIEEVGAAATPPVASHSDPPARPSEVPAAGEPPAAAVDRNSAAKREIESLYHGYQTMDHWEVLGIERGATQESVAAAFRKKATLYHPDNYHHIRDREFQEHLSHVFLRLKEAHETLSHEEDAKGYDRLTEKEGQYEQQNKEWSAPPKKEVSSTVEAAPPVRSADEGMALFARAKRAYIQRDFWNTIQFCQQAIEIVSDNAEIYHLLAMAQKENPKWRKDAEKNLQIAIKLDPWKPDYLLALGKLYQEGGLHTRAAKVLEQARTLDPGLETPDVE
ncbi:MAG TPA: DnaJ domain-containing protein [Vicinamibacteria bacterium]